MFSGEPVSQISRRNLLVTGMSLAAWTAASMIQGCGSENYQTAIAPNPNPQPPINPGPDLVPVAPPAFVQPPVLRSVNGLLETTLNVQLGANQVGAGLAVTVESGFTLVYDDQGQTSPVPVFQGGGTVTPGTFVP